MYRKIWTPVVDENLRLAKQVDNKFDRYAVQGLCTVNGDEEKEVGHIPKEISRIMSSIIDDTDCNITVTVTGEYRGSKGGKGLEVPIKIVVASVNRQKIKKIERQLKGKPCVE